MSKYGVISGPYTGKYGPEITPYLDTHLDITFDLTELDRWIRLVKNKSRTQKKVLLVCFSTGKRHGVKVDPGPQSPGPGTRLKV